jgi:hypothetical protein
MPIKFYQTKRRNILEDRGHLIDWLWWGETDVSEPRTIVHPSGECERGSRGDDTGWG